MKFGSVHTARQSTSGWDISQKLKETLKSVGQTLCWRSCPILSERTFLIKNKRKISHEAVSQLI